MSVREAQQRIDSREFAEWMAFNRIEPFGDEWRQTARVVSWLAATATRQWRDEETFMPGQRKEQSPAVQQMNLRLQDRARAGRAKKAKRT